ncbi:glycoside hydrolase family 13 protein [Lewinella sp. W8]|uniref:glycoside hydrolase family 13 protein n=1 Tax=Lewinella sp. W8 TaxID=2528208 RepID=UPI0010679F32|nr:glycoside hydrolase family 13 protein [Lewinella sp. W8]MTB51075.1 alpha-amylase [Lewinella sp. W8]
MRTLLLLCILFFTFPLSGQEESIYDDDPMQELPLGMEHAEYKIRYPSGKELVQTRVEPMHWWVDMVDPRLEVLIYDRNVARYDQATVDYPGVSVEYVKRLENPNYLFVGLYIAPGTQPGAFPIKLASRVRAQNEPTETKSFEYTLRAHPRLEKGPRTPLSQDDFIYLIMPDRFANGDPDNDSVAGMAQQGVNRDKFLFRHGGDLTGILGKLDYLEDLGVTAIWLNPVLENDQPYQSYHGYAVTDHYRIDRRFGSNEDYKALVTAAHERGIKVIMDVIFNHVGDHHWFIEDLPSMDWIHQWPEYTKTTYRATTVFDPHASEYDKRLMTDGWFDKHMPDLNQQNPHLANYLIQNSIWWTLYSGQDAFRIDTYAYPDAAFMARWNQRLREEIPDLGIFGETWVHGPGVQAWFAGGRNIHQDFDSHLPGVTDFQLHYAINEALSVDPGWKEGVLKLYYTLAQDYLYEDPTKNVLFLDNHDLGRIFSTVNRDMTKFKSGLALLMTLRGIPVMYYGTELAFTGAGGAFGEGGRVGFPGGFAGDDRNLFSDQDRDATEREAFNYVRRLAQYRQKSAAMSHGTLTQFLPQEGVYVFFRRAGKEQMMVIFNGSSKTVEDVNLVPYEERLAGYSAGYDLTKDRELNSLEGMTLAPKETRIIFLK